MEILSDLTPFRSDLVVFVNDVFIFFLGELIVVQRWVKLVDVSKIETKHKILHLILLSNKIAKNC